MAAPKAKPAAKTKKLSGKTPAKPKPSSKTANYTKPALREKLKEKITAGDKGGRPGQWSARKAQLLATEYKGRRRRLQRRRAFGRAKAPASLDEGKMEDGGRQARRAREDHGALPSEKSLG